MIFRHDGHQVPAFWLLLMLVSLVFGSSVPIQIFADDAPPTASSVPGLTEKHEERLEEATRLSDRVVELYRAGEFAEAIPAAQRILAIRREIFGEEHPSYAISLNNLALLYQEMGEYSKAEPLYEQALEIRRKAIGEEDTNYAISLSNLAGLYRHMGEYAKAEPRYRQSLEITREVFGKEHPSYATSLNNLAVLYRDMGEYVNAETLFEQILETWRQTLGEEHPYYAVTLNNLGLLYADMADYAKAASLYQRVLDIIKKTLGEEHPSYATCLNNLAGLYWATGEHEKAESLYRQSLEIIRRALSEMHPSYAKNLNNLAFLYSSMGEYAQAEDLHRQAQEITQKALGKEHPSYAISLSSLARLYRAIDEHAKAEPLYRQSLEITRKTLGEEHPSYAATLNNLANLYGVMGDYAKAAPLYRDAFGKSLTFFSRTADWLPESRAMTLRQQWTGPAPLLLALRRLPDHDPHDAYDAVWRSRALVTRLLTERRRAAAATPEAAVLYEQLRWTQQQLAELTLAEPPAEYREARRRRLTELNDQKEDLETELARISLPFRRETELEQIEPGELARILPQGAAVIDIAALRVWDQDPQSGKLAAEEHYEAFVLRSVSDDPGWAVTWVHLGPTEPIDEALAAWRQAVMRRERLPEAEDRPDRALRRLVWEKLEPYLEGRSEVYVIPDGDLAFLPWAALPGRRPGTCLIEDYSIVTALNGQELYRGLTESPSAAGGLLLVGDVHYDHPATAPSGELLATADDQAPRTRSPAPGAQAVWRALPGTVEEVASIEQTWNSQGPLVVLRGAGAGESALRAHLPSNRYIHLATHGFFADAEYRSMFGYDARSEELFGLMEGSPASRGQVTVRNPLLLSGIVLAGANLPPQTDSLGLPTGEDGILTAEEIVSLDLRGTELVVLSACETGLGSVGGGEGVFGLQRAFHLAGARNVVASLWKVDDQAAAALMQLFYYKLWNEGKPAATALREAQLALYRHPDQIGKLAGLRGPDFEKVVRAVEQPVPTPAHADARDWAAFVLSGPGR